MIPNTLQTRAMGKAQSPQHLALLGQVSELISILDNVVHDSWAKCCSIYQGHWDLASAASFKIRRKMQRKKGEHATLQSVLWSYPANRFGVCSIFMQWTAPCCLKLGCMETVLKSVSSAIFHFSSALYSIVSFISSPDSLSSYRVLTWLIHSYP